MSALTASTRCWPCTRPACRPYPTQTRPASTTWPSTRASSGPGSGAAGAGGRGARPRAQGCPPPLPGPRLEPVAAWTPRPQTPSASSASVASWWPRRKGTGPPGHAGGVRVGAGRRRATCSRECPLHEGSPLGELHRCIREGVKVNVHIRTFKGLRGVCTGFLVAFDKFWNMALTDVDETYRKPVLGKAYERDSSLTLTRLFDRLKLQDSSKKDADSKSAVEDSTLSRYSQTSTWKASAREESRSEMSGRTTRTEGSSAGGTFSRATTLSRGQPRKKKRKPKVDYQQVFTRHINQIFIRGENVLLVHLAQ
ncbi:U7 snRNA-associated Sm-like protein LSm11 isoform X1 [Prionailurus iriomotensis]